MKTRRHTRCDRAGMLPAGGLGILGLLTLLAVLCIGQPAAAEPAQAAPHASVETLYNHAVLFDQGEMSRWTFGSTENRVALSLNVHRWHWTIQAAYISPTGRLAASDADGLSGQLFATKPFVKTTAALETPNRHLRFELGFSPRTDVAAEGFLGLRFRPAERVSTAIEFGRENMLPASGEFWYAAEGGDVDVFSLSQYSRLSIDAAFSNGLRIRSSLKSSHRDKLDKFANDENRRAQYQMSADGLVRHGSASIDFTNKAGWKLAVAFNASKIDGRLIGYEAGRRFLHIGVVNFDFRQTTVSLSHSRWRLGLHHGSVEGDISGVVDAWPFLSGLAIFLGERRHLVAEGAVDWKQIEAALGQVHLWKLRLGIRLDYYRVHPTATYVTWRPLFLGFGIDDLRRDQIDLRRADIIRLQLNTVIRWQGMKLQVAASQLAPLSLAYHSDSKNSSSGESNSSDADDTKTPHQGFSLRLGLSTAF